LGVDLTLIDHAFLRQNGGVAKPFADVIEGDSELLDDSPVVYAGERQYTDETNSGKSSEDIEIADPTKED
jgi:hypothetical protein